METVKKPLLGMTLAELKEVARGLGMPAFTGGQMAQWLYQKHVASIDEMTNLSKQNRQRLAEHYTVGTMLPTDCQRSVDGTVKYLFPVLTQNAPDTSQDAPCPRHFVETVFIPDGERATLCVSCQVGCKMNCLFCQTGKQGWHGNLTAADILNQLHALPEREQLTNIVFMGQGEPMDNLDAVLRATEVLTAEWGWAWSPRRITVSSVGVRNKLQRFIEESECHVAISLHSPLLVFGGLNDTPRHAKAIVNLLRGLDCRINLIRFHQIPDVPLHGSDEKTMEWLRDYLTQHGVFTTIRASRGQDIYAACGLLSTAKQEAEDQPQDMKPSL